MRLMQKGHLGVRSRQGDRGLGEGLARPPARLHNNTKAHFCAAAFAIPRIRLILAGHLFLGCSPHRVLLCDTACHSCLHVWMAHGMEAPQGGHALLLSHGKHLVPPSRDERKVDVAVIIGWPSEVLGCVQSVSISIAARKRVRRVKAISFMKLPCCSSGSVD